MSSLLDLPSELLLKVNNQVGPAEIEAYAASCQTLRHMSEDALRLHLSRKQKYRSLLVRNEYDGPSPKLVEVLSEILVDERVALYVEDLRVDCFEFRLYEDGITEGLPLPEVLRKRLANLFRTVCRPYPTARESHNIRAETIKEASRANHTIRRIANEVEDDEEDGHVILFLMLFPNLRSLSIAGYSVASRRFKKWMDDLIGSSPKFPMLLAGDIWTPLSKLDRVDLIYPRNGRSADWKSIVDLAQFARLPSMRSIHVRAIDCPVDPFQPEPIPWLEEIDIVHGCVRTYNLVNLIRSTKALKRFSYEHVYEHDGEMMKKDYQVGPLLPVLMSCASESLEHLSLSAFEGYEKYMCGEDTVTLKEFKSLQYVRVPYDVLFRGSNHAAPGNVGQDMFPPSVQQVVLQGPMRRSQIDSLVPSLVKDKGKLLPALKQLEVNHNGGKTAAPLRDMGQGEQDARASVAACERAGFELTVHVKTP